MQETTRCYSMKTQLQAINGQPLNKQTKESKFSTHLNCGISRHRKVQRLRVFHRKGETEKSYVFFHCLLLFCSVNDTPGYNVIKYLVLCSSPLK